MVHYEQTHLDASITELAGTFRMTLTGMKKHIVERALRPAGTARRAVEAETTRPINERNSPLNTRFNSTTQVSLPSDTEIRITRDFNAPRTVLWQAHVDPQLFRRWIGGYPGWSMPVCELDVRPGGAFRWRWRQDEEGKEFGFFGDYREVDAPATIVSAEYFDPGSFGGDMPTSPTINRTTFTEQNGVTTLVVLIEYASKDARDGAISTGMTDGMETSYARLDALVAELHGG